ncbi:MAG: M48 family metallopeptidase [Bryobacterales bacterium]|nr:M48 family metallopeptidase [Bryobacterales bacterium]
MPGEGGVPETQGELYARIFRELRPRSPLPAIEVSFRHFANVNSFIELKQGRLIVRISDILTGAPAEVHEALAWILLGKLLRKSVSRSHANRYRRFLNRKDVVAMVERVRRRRGRKHLLPPQGKHYDLSEIFGELNLRFFWGLMAPPTLGWSAKPSYSVLGHYDSAHHSITLSSLLDAEVVPRLVVEYVLYHEMLHIRYPVERKGGKRCVHTEEFRRAEEQFPDFEEAKLWIGKICAIASRSAGGKGVR